MKILVVSPIPSHPQNAGNRVRIYTLLMNLKEQGHEIHLLFDDREYWSDHVTSKSDIQAMARTWHKVHLPGTSIPWPFVGILSPLVSQPIFHKIDKYFEFVRTNALRLRYGPGKFVKETFPSLYERLHSIFIKIINRKVNVDKDKPSEIDKWYNPRISRTAFSLHEKYKFDVVIAVYVFMSKVLESFDDNVLKIIDTHDIVTNRSTEFKDLGIADNFFSTSAAEEAKGLNRADKIIAIQDHENRFFQTLTDKEVVTIGHSVELSEPETRRETRKEILYIGTGNSANVQGINTFLEAALPLIRSRIPEFRLTLAGHICKFVDSHEGVERLGEVRDIKNAYNKADVVINPAIVGTGLKIKNIEALGFGKILIASSHSAAGLDIENPPFLIADSSEEFANTIVNVLSNLRLHNDLAIEAYQYAKRYNKQQIDATKNLLIWHKLEAPQ